MKTFSTLLIIITMSLALNAQRSTFIGFESGLTHDVYTVSDFGGVIGAAPLIDWRWGVTLSRELNSNFSLETGLIGKTYWEGFRTSIDGLVLGIASNSMSTLQIPLRIVNRWGIFRDRAYFTTSIGYLHAFNLDYSSYSYGGGKIHTSNGDSLDYTYTEKMDFRRSFPLLETGLGLEYRLTRKLFLELSASYALGFMRTIQLDYNYTRNGVDGAAMQHSKGDYAVVGISLRYGLSRWAGA